MNHVEFAVNRDGLVDIVVDGRSLASELDVAFIKPEDFPGLVVLWRGRAAQAPAWSEAPPGTAPLFNCGCGIFGCGGKTVAVRADRHTLTWKIGGPFGPDDRVTVGPFTFRWDQFEQARRSVMARLAELHHRA